MINLPSFTYSYYIYNVSQDNAFNYYIKTIILSCVHKHKIFISMLFSALFRFLLVPSSPCLFFSPNHLLETIMNSRNICLLTIYISLEGIIWVFLVLVFSLFLDVLFLLFRFYKVTHSNCSSLFIYLRGNYSSFIKWVTCFVTSNISMGCNFAKCQCVSNFQ